jgi:uncharacterized protein YjbJ (UPF0337 family)
MAWDRIEANWKQFRGMAQKQWSKLTDEDLEAAAGREEALAARIQERYGVEKEEAGRQIKEWMKEPGVLDDWNDTKPILDM